MIQTKLQKRDRLKRKIRVKISGSAERPRLSVFRSSQYIYAQLINDDTATTMAEANDLKITDKATKMDRAKLVGKTLAEKAIKLGVTSVVFDRNGFAYKGRLSALADSAREAGLKF